ncbi:MAG: N-acetyl-alpha-D-glucosaminyl L-malate synthase BshA [bacterium]
MDRKLKIGITCYPTFGGSGVVATELGIALANSGHEVHFITNRLPVRLQKSLDADISFHGVNVLNYALFPHEPYTLALASKMAQVVDSYNLDLLHVHYAIPHAVSAHLAKEMLDGRFKVVTTLHGTDITLVGNDPSLHPITRFAINNNDAVTAVSAWLRDETIREFSPNIDIEVIENSVDIEQFSPEVGREWAGRHYCEEGLPNLIHVSNFRPVKRAPDVVHVFAKVLEQEPARLLMVGDGPDLPTAMQAAKELGVSDKVSFLGNREDVNFLMASSCIMLMPSQSESFGLAALEAMACECAVIASRTGGLPDLVRDGVDGYICEQGDIDGMAGRVVSLLRDPARLTQMKQAARSRAVDSYRVEIIMEKYLALYDRVLSQQRNTALV